MKNTKHLKHIVAFVLTGIMILNSFVYAVKADDDIVDVSDISAIEISDPEIEEEFTGDIASDEISIDTDNNPVVEDGDEIGIDELTSDESSVECNEEFTIEEEITGSDEENELFFDEYPDEYLIIEKDDDISRDGRSLSCVFYADYIYGLTDKQKEYVIGRCKQIVADNITEDMSDLEKYWTLANWIKKNVKYPSKNKEYPYDIFSDNYEYTAYGPHGALKYGYGVCQGQSLLYYLLCHAADLPCDYMSMPYHNHVVNYLPNINGKDYLIDVTNDMFGMSLNTYAFTNDKEGIPRVFGQDLDMDRLPLSFDCKNDEFTYRRGIVHTYKYDEDSGEYSIDDGYSVKRYKEPGTIEYQTRTVNNDDSEKIMLIWQEKSVTYPMRFVTKDFDTFYSKILYDEGDANYPRAARYVEMGSGIRGEHYTHYADYALGHPENTGDWIHDDFGKDFTLNQIYFDKVEISGLKESYLFDNEDDYLTALKNDVIVTYNNRALKLDGDYTISLDYVGETDGRITITGIRYFYGSKRVSFKLTPIDEREKEEKYIDIVVNERDEKDIDELVLPYGNECRIKNNYQGIANVNWSSNKKCFYVSGRKKGSAQVRIISKDTIYVLNITVIDVKTDVQNITLIAGNKALYSDIDTDYLHPFNSYSISSPIVAVDKTGNIQAKKVGNATVRYIKAHKDIVANITVIIPAFPVKTFVKNVGDEFDAGFDANDLTVEYSTNKPSVATVDENGHVKILNKGSAGITACVQGKKYTVNVKAYDPEIVAKTTQLLVDNKWTSLSVKNGNGKTQWSSSDPGIVIVNNGKIKGISKGMAKITAINNGRSMSVDIKVNTVPKFDNKLYVTNVDKPIKVAVTKDDDMDGAIYSINNKKIASIDENGLLIPITKGSVTVSATVCGKVYKTTVKIFDPVINGKDTAKVGKTVSFSIKNGYGSTIWSVEGDAVIDQKGRLTAKSIGEVTVVAINNGRECRKTVSIVK